METFMNKQEAVLYPSPYVSVLNKSSDSIVLAVNGKIKRLTCKTALLDDILSHIGPSAIFQDIVQAFVGTYPSSTLEHFLDTLIRAEVLVCKNGQSFTHTLRNEGIDPASLHDILQKNPPLFIGDGVLAEALLSLVKNTVHDFSPARLRKSDLPCETDGDYTQWVKFFEHQLKKGGHTGAVFCPDAAPLQHLVALNQACLALHIPFMLAYFNGKHLLLGPTVIPWKSPCYACLIQHRLNFIHKNNALDLSFSDALKITEAWPLPADPSQTGAVAWAAGLILAELYRVLQGNICPRYLRRQVRIPLDGSCDCTEISFAALTMCPACSGLNQKLTLGRPESLPALTGISLKKSEVRHTDGGMRTISGAEAGKIIDRAFNRLGLAVTVKQLNAGPLDKILPTFHTRIEEFYRADFPFAIAPKNQGGKGLSPEQAFLSGSFELIERICADYYGDVEMVRASYREVRDMAVNVEARIGTVYCDYGLDRFDANMPIDWVWGYSLSTQRPLLVPASMVYLTKNLFLGNFHPTTSGGLAAGTSMEDAILQGLYETIEHDSWMIYQANALTPSRVRPESIPESSLQEIIKKIQHAGYRVIINYLRNDLDIPVFRTWLVNEKDYVNFACCGYGANLDPLTALSRSLTEAKLSAPSLKRQENLCFQSHSTADLILNKSSVFSLYQFMQTDVFPERSYIDFHDIKNHSTGSIEEDLQKTVQFIQNNIEQADIIFVNLTQKVFNIPVVKIIAVGIQSFFKPIQCTQDRLFSMPQKIGLSEKELRYVEIFNGSFPH